MMISPADVTIPSPTPHLRAFRRGSTGWLVLNRPERRNALSAEMWRALPALVEGFSADVNVRSIALTGAAGADISEFAANRDDAEAARLYDAMTLDAFAARQGCRKPALAMIEANAPLSIAAAKGMVNALSGAPHAAGGDQLQALADACFESDDYKEGRRAFLEKRPPQFSGR
jgi:enoyl-CoA hydratase/carnithine racemase